MELIKFNKSDLTLIKNKVMINILKTLLSILLFLTILLIFSPAISAQQIYAGGGYYYTPLNLLMQSSETTLSLNSYYEASIKCLIEIYKNWLFSFTLFRNTFDYLNPNALSLDLIYFIKGFISRIKILLTLNDGENLSRELFNFISFKLFIE